MADRSKAEIALELEGEKRLLVKADADIEAGLTRIRNQQDVLSSLQTAGENTREAERLAHLLEQTLVEWRRHRALIGQRIAHLEREVLL
ncbi:MAG TPA: hypothetical protein VMM15_08605 [Bradyrhizobium sp.]|nr:hypothetical protein [Bradyrhizobium sp.]